MLVHNRKKTNKEDWIRLKHSSRRQNLPKIKPIPYTPREGEGRDFDVKISPEDLRKVRDDFGDIRFEKVYDFLLPTIQGEKYWDWLAVRMRNYMAHIVRSECYTPRFYKPFEDKVILGRCMCSRVQSGD